MPRDSNGNYSLPPGYLAVTGETILASQHNPPLEDLGASMTASLPRNGSAGMLANLNLGGNKAVNAAVATAASDVPTLAQVQGLIAAVVTGDVSGPASSVADRIAVFNGTTGKLLKDGGSTIADLVKLPPAHINGLLLSNNVIDATNDIDIGPGACRSLADDADIRLAATITKRLDAAWAVGSGNGGLDTGAVTNATYHVWMIRRSDTGVVDVLFSLSATAPTMPANYNAKRRIGAVIRKSGAILPFTQLGNTWLLTTLVSSVALSNPSVTAVLAPMEVPDGVQVTAILAIYLQSAETVRRVLLVTSPDQADVVPSAGTASTFAAGASFVQGNASGEIRRRTNSSRQIRYRMDGASTDTSLFIATVGWIDEV